MRCGWPWLRRQGKNVVEEYSVDIVPALLSNYIFSEQNFIATLTCCVCNYVLGIYAHTDI